MEEIKFRLKIVFLILFKNWHWHECSRCLKHYVSEKNHIWCIECHKNEGLNDISEYGGIIFERE